MSDTTPETTTTIEESHQQPPSTRKKQQYQGGNGEDRPNYHQQGPRFRKQSRPVYVEDLREKLNRKRRENDKALVTSASGPPPDPNYNFLKDPARDGDSTAPASEKRNQHNQNRRPNDTRSRYHPSRNQKTTTIQPVNIKVELSTSTGQRSCTVDEKHKLPEMKHVPDRWDGGRRPYNTRYYSKSSTTHQQHKQQQSSQHQKRSFQQPNRRAFRDEEQKGDSKEAESRPVLEENWDLARKSNGTGGKNDVDGGQGNSNTQEENWDNPPHSVVEQKEVGKSLASEEEKSNESEGESGIDGEKDQTETKDEKQSIKREIVEGTIQKAAEEEATKQDKEADLKESIIIEPSNK